MANPAYLELLNKGVLRWNQWRKMAPSIEPDLREANLSGVYLSGVNLRSANLSKANLSGAKLLEAYLREANFHKANLREAELLEAYLLEANLNETDLSGANLREADLRRVTLMHANLHKANLRGADLRGAELYKCYLSECDLSKCDLTGFDLSRTDLSGADLHECDLSYVNLSGANLHGVDLSGANLHGVDLSGLDLRGVDLSGAKLSKSQVLGTRFETAILTGACLEAWNVSGTTNFADVICDYFYAKANQQERRPRKGNFKPGEFAALFQQAVDTIDLIFKDGVDWQTFFKSFQDLRSQYADQDISIQSIEKKPGGAFIVRIQVPEHSDKAAIEHSAKELYETKLTLMEQRYRAELQAKDGEIVAYKEQSTNLMKITEMLSARPSMSETPKYDFRGAQFAGGYVGGNVEGDQIGGTINNYGSSAADITRLMTALREHAQAFPDDQKDEALDTLDDLEGDLAKAEPDPGRIGRRLKRLAAIATALTIGTTGFAADLAQLAETLNVPLPTIQVEQVQPEQLPPSN